MRLLGIASSLAALLGTGMPSITTALTIRIVRSLIANPVAVSYTHLTLPTN